MEHNEINSLIIQLSNEPFSPTLSLQIASEYERIGQTAAAISFYLRTAEYGYHTHKEYVYASLLRASYCFENQTGRKHTVKNLIEKAIAYSPKRPEAWFLLSRYYEREQKWQESYTYAEVGIQMRSFNKLALPINVEYVGDFVLEFQKAVAAWWVGRQDESETLFRELAKMPLPEPYKGAVESNMVQLGWAST